MRILEAKVGDSLEVTSESHLICTWCGKEIEIKTGTVYQVVVIYGARHGLSGGEFLPYVLVKSHDLKCPMCNMRKFRLHDDVAIAATFDGEFIYERS